MTSQQPCEECGGDKKHSPECSHYKPPKRILSTIWGAGCFIISFIVLFLISQGIDSAVSAILPANIKKELDNLILFGGVALVAAALFQNYVASRFDRLDSSLQYNFKQTNERIEQMSHRLWTLERQIREAGGMQGGSAS